MQDSDFYLASAVAYQSVADVADAVGASAPFIGLLTLIALIQFALSIGPDLYWRSRAIAEEIVDSLDS